MRTTCPPPLEIITTLDGTTLYPVDRARMQDDRAIIQRMAGDIAELIDEAGEDGAFTRADLILRGWKSLQVTIHGEAAMNRYRNDWARSIGGKVAA